MELFRSGLRMGRNNPTPSVPLDATLLKNVPWDEMGWKIFRIILLYSMQDFKLSHPMRQTFFTKFFLLRTTQLFRNRCLSRLFERNKWDIILFLSCKWLSS